MLNNPKFSFKKADVNKSVSIEPIRAYLVSQIDVLNHLEQVIEAEYLALKNRTFDQLKPLSTAKSDWMLRLQRNDQKIKLHPDVALLKTTYAAEVLIIKNKMKKCQFRNSVNGKLITMSMQSANRMQALLLGVRDVVTRNMTYTSKGNAVARGPSRLSVCA